MHHRASVPLLILLALLLAVPARPASAFSVLAHQAVIDRSWDDVIVPGVFNMELAIRNDFLRF